LPTILTSQRTLYNTERKQAEGIRVGKKFWEQLDFEGYLTKREKGSGLQSSATFTGAWGRHLGMNPWIKILKALYQNNHF